MHKINPDKNRKTHWTFISGGTITEEVEFNEPLTKEEAEQRYSYGELLNEDKSVKVATEIIEIVHSF